MVATTLIFLSTWLVSKRSGAGSPGNISNTPWLARRMPPIRLATCCANCSAAMRALLLAAASMAGLMSFSLVNR